MAIIAKSTHLGDTRASNLKKDESSPDWRKALDDRLHRLSKNNDRIRTRHFSSPTRKLYMPKLSRHVTDEDWVVIENPAPIEAQQPDIEEEPGPEADESDTEQPTDEEVIARIFAAADTRMVYFEKQLPSGEMRDYGLDDFIPLQPHAQEYTEKESSDPVYSEQKQRGSLDRAYPEQKPSHQAYPEQTPADQLYSETSSQVEEDWMNLLNQLHGVCDENFEKELPVTHPEIEAAWIEAAEELHASIRASHAMGSDLNMYKPDDDQEPMQPVERTQSPGGPSDGTWQDMADELAAERLTFMRAMDASDREVTSFYDESIAETRGVPAPKSARKVTNDFSMPEKQMNVLLENSCRLVSDLLQNGFEPGDDLLHKTSRLSAAVRRSKSSRRNSAVPSLISDHSSAATDSDETLGNRHSFYQQGHRSIEGSNLYPRPPVPKQVQFDAEAMQAPKYGPRKRASREEYAPNLERQEKQDRRRAGTFKELSALSPEKSNNRDFWRQRSMEFNRPGSFANGHHSDREQLLKPEAEDDDVHLRPKHNRVSAFIRKMAHRGNRAEK